MSVGSPLFAQLGCGRPRVCCPRHWMTPGGLWSTARRAIWIPSAHLAHVSIMATPDARPAVERMAAADGLALDDFPFTVAARIVLRIGLYTPIRYAAAVTCPALIQVACDDAVTSTSEARKAASRMPQATLKSYPGHHFDVYVEPLFDTVIADQLEFLRSVAPVTA